MSHQPQQEPLDIEPAHVMPREKHKAREHYEAMLRELQNEQPK